jgi:hypothetical protein
VRFSMGWRRVKGTLGVCRCGVAGLKAKGPARTLGLSVLVFLATSILTSGAKLIWHVSGFLMWFGLRDVDGFSTGEGA